MPTSVLSKLLNRTPYAAHRGQRWLGFCHTRGVGGALFRADEVALGAVAGLALVNLFVLAWLGDQPTTPLVYGFYLAFVAWHLHQVGRALALSLCGGPLTQDDVERLHDWMREHPSIAEHAAHWMGTDELLRKRDYHLIRRAARCLSREQGPTRAQKRAEREKERSQAEHAHEAILSQWRAHHTAHPWPAGMNEQEKWRCKKALDLYKRQAQGCARHIQSGKAPSAAYVGTSKALSWGYAGIEAFGLGMVVGSVVFFIFTLVLPPLFSLPSLDFSSATLNPVFSRLIPLIGAASLGIAALSGTAFMWRWHRVWRHGVASPDVLLNLEAKLIRHPTLRHDIVSALPPGSLMTPEHVRRAYQAFKPYRAYLDRIEEEQSARQISNLVRALPAVQIAQAQRQAQDLAKNTPPVDPPGCGRRL